jgi:NADH-quinone oxidoreductase subunit M
MQGPVKETLKNRLAELNIREILILIPIIILIIWMGVYPSSFIKKISVPISIQKYIMTIKGDR